VVRAKVNNAVTALAASPWAPLVAIGGQKQIVLYNTETLQPIGVLPFPEGFPTIIRFSRNRPASPHWWWPWVENRERSCFGMC
jgi:hypothetical protein